MMLPLIRSMLKGETGKREEIWFRDIFGMKKNGSGTIFDREVEGKESKKTKGHVVD